MCRNIRQLHNFEPPATTDEVIDYLKSLPKRPCGENTPTGKPNYSEEVPK